MECLARNAKFAALLGVLALSAPPLAKARSPSTLPSGVAELRLMCAVDDEGLSKLCRFYNPIADEKARRVAGMELGWLDAHPFDIAGAPARAESYGGELR